MELFDLPIPPSPAPALPWPRVPIQECGEEILCLDTVPLDKYRLMLDPQYFRQGLPGACVSSFLRESVANRLVEAASRLPDNLRLVVWDAWRPLEGQKFLFERRLKAIRSQSPSLSLEEARRRAAVLIAPPDTGSAPPPHSTGGAADVALVTEDGVALPLGTPYNHFNALTATRYFEEKLLVSPKLQSGEQMTAVEHVILRNRRLLYGVMTAAGFVNDPLKWWHFSYGDQFWAAQTGAKCALYGRAE